jgi:hypothetical protein
MIPLPLDLETLLQALVVLACLYLLAADEGWEIRRGVASESNPQACDGHLCPHCRRHA